MSFFRPGDGFDALTSVSERLAKLEHWVYTIGAKLFGVVEFLSTGVDEQRSVLGSV